MKDLKPCPFCGSTYIKMITTPSGFSWVKCDQCGCELYAEDNKDEAVAVWNKRED